MTDTPLQTGTPEAGQAWTFVPTPGVVDLLGAPGARPQRPRARVALVAVSRPRLTVIAVVSLVATALLALAVSRGYNGFRLERHTLHLLGHPQAVDRWGQLADILAAPVIAVVVVTGLVFGALRGIAGRVALLAACAGIAFLISEQVMKPLVQGRFQGLLSFPSGHVTAVCATALAMWMALYPVLGRWGRITTFLLGAAWTGLISVAVVGALWHTPIDDIGSLFLSVGIVTAGAAVLAPKRVRGQGQVPPAEPARVMERV
jgi:membrane-associated phospholipid phosphatase